MAKKIDIKNSIVKQIANDFFNKIPFYYNASNEQLINSVEDFRKIISSGGVSTTTGQQNQLVLYQQDYQAQTPPTDFDIVVDNITRCYCMGTVVGDGVGDHDSINYFQFEVISQPDTLGYDYFTIESNSYECEGEISITVTDSILSILSQYIPFDYTQINIDPVQANQVLDTNIFELLPRVSERQQQIDSFFTAYSNLKGEYPTFVDNNQDGLFDTPTDRDAFDIQVRPDDGFIPRLDQPSNSLNDTQNLQWLRDDLNLFLEDVDQRGIDDLDDRPDYEDKSDGYLKIRHMNQFIIVRKEEGDDVGIQDSYLEDGFTITMWVKFLDKVNGGTLFNFGNPLRAENPKGFMLETFVVNTNDGDFFEAPDDAFSEGETERFVRLVVREENIDNNYVDGIRDSHFGRENLDRLITTGGEASDINDFETLPRNSGGVPALEFDINYAFNYTRVPIDLTEWYFIVANYNPTVLEDESGFNDEAVSDNPEYWQWNYDGNTYSSFTGLGSRCKVEIISKSDLIRARGFKQS